MKYLIILIATAILLQKTASAQKIELINSGELLKQGMMAHDSGQYKKALSIYNGISRSDTNYVRSLYERAMTCEVDSQYKQAIRYCEEAFSLHEQREYIPDLYNVYGNSLHADGQAERAIKVFDKAIGLYPASALLYFNKGVILLDEKRYSEAEAVFQKALLINPYIYSAHYQLGLAAIRQGKIIPAYLCFTGYLMVNPSGKYWSKSINGLSQISRATDEVLGLKEKRTAQPDANYQAVEDIVLSKIALDKSYKPIIALDDEISRQMQAILEKLEYSVGDNDFYIQYYLPYFKKTFAEGKFELFVNHIFLSANVKLIQDYNKKNKKELEAFVNDAAVYFDLIRATRELNYKKRDQIKEHYHFDNGKLIGKGVLADNGKTLIGHWEFYYPAGNLKGTGEYNMQGQREGEWKFYYPSGALKSIERHKNGKLEGEMLHYFENGNLSSKESYVHDKLDGQAQTWYYAGSIRMKSNYSEGKKEGEVIDYYSNGNIYRQGHYSADQLNGTLKEYYKNGVLKSTEEYTGGKAEGTYQSFHKSGKLWISGQNAKDKGYGEWKYYYDNGKQKEKRNYVNDLEEGLHEDYFESGQVSGSYMVKKGKMDGEATFYYKDGQVLSKLMYDNGVIRSARYFDETGKQLSAAQLKGDRINILSYELSGRKRENMTYDNKGNQTGADTLFYACGKTSQVSYYVKGDLDGPLVAYFLNGSKKLETSYKGGKENGLSVHYYSNGQIESEGWVVDGSNQGEWDYFDEKGRMTVKTFFLDGDMHGYREEFHTDGKKFLEQKYYNGWIERMVQYDTKGNEMTVDSFPKGSGKFVLYHPGGKVMTECDYVNGDFNGFYKTYFFDGSLATSAHYTRGLQDSIFQGFYFGGVKSTEGRYLGGDRTGLWKYYQEDGKLHTTVTYANDQKNGPEIHFLPDGGKDQVSLYRDGELDGIYTMNNPDGSMAYQINFEEGYAHAYSYPGKDGNPVPFISLSPVNDTLKAYFPNGKIARLCTYTNGLKNGRDVLYFPNGQVCSEGNTNYGILEGRYQEYYINGKPKYDYAYHTDNNDGICREYYPDGALKKEEPYDNGFYEGTVKYYDAGGKPLKMMIYTAGSLLTVENEK